MKLAKFLLVGLCASGCLTDVEPDPGEAVDESSDDDAAFLIDRADDTVVADDALIEALAADMRALEQAGPEAAPRRLEEPGAFDDGSTGASWTSAARVVGHDDIAPLRVGASAFHARWRPQLSVHLGCVPHPAVDAAGNTSGGLQNSGSWSGSCGRNEGQVYARTHCFSSNVCGTMYAWYFPKDGGAGGHRHDWEDVIVWTKGVDASAQFLAAAYSQHGKYQIRKGSTANRSGTNLKVRYQRGPLGITNHALYPTESGGGYQPVASWIRIPGAARHALNVTSFGSANCPINDGRFINEINKARFW